MKVNVEPVYPVKSKANKRPYTQRCYAFPPRKFSQQRLYCCVISGFHHKVDYIFTLLRYYAEFDGNSLLKFRDNISVPKCRKAITAIRCVISKSVKLSSLIGVKDTSPRIYFLALLFLKALSSNIFKKFHDFQRA